MRMAFAAALLALASPVRAGVVDVRGSADRVDLRVEAAPLSDVLDRLAKQTGMKVIYEGPPPRQMISVALQGRTPAEAVLGLLEGQGLNYLLQMDATGQRVQTLMMAGGASGGSSGGGSGLAGGPGFVPPTPPRPQPPVPVPQVLEPPPTTEAEPAGAESEMAEEAQSEEEAADANVERQMNGEGAPGQPKEEKGEPAAQPVLPNLLPGVQPFSPFAPPNAVPPPIFPTEPPAGPPTKNPKEQPPKEQ